MKQLFKKNKYLFNSTSLLMAMILMLGFDADTPSDFFLKLGKVVFYALATGFGVYLLSMFSGWLLFPFAPKQEDFSSEKDRVEFYNLGSWDLVLFMFLIIGVTLVFSGFIK